MSACLIVTSEREVEHLLPLAWKIARTENRDLQVVIVRQKEGPRQWRAVELERTEADSHPDLLETVRRLARLDSPPPQKDVEATGQPLSVEDLKIRILRDALPDRALLDELVSCKLMMIALHEPVRDSTRTWSGRLYRTAPGETIYLRVPAVANTTFRRILVPTNGKMNANAALRRADALCQLDGGEVTALYIEPQLDVVSKDVGIRRLDRIVKRAVGNKDERIRKKVIVGNDVMQGFRQAMKESYDLILVGAYWDRTIRRFFYSRESSEQLSTPDAPAIAAVRAAMPFRTRFQRFCERQVQQFVPQLNRDERVSLVDRVEGSSRWDFDFIALICLSTAIAALGLVKNQAAVVIGAMLLAPLMTPLIGAGLAVVQGNTSLIRCTLQTVLRGFVVAFAIGYLIGLASEEGFTQEILKRTSPGPVDLVVALFGGIAAAYATCRPNLSSALPGVAIAAALVPPIATAGITLAHREWTFALGALLLFLTNIVAIVVGTAFSLWMVGIRDTHQHGTKQSWTSWFMAILLAASIALGFAISRQAAATDRNVLSQLQSEIESVIDSTQTGVQLADFQKLDDYVLLVIVESGHDDIGSLAEDLGLVARKHFDTQDASVKLEVRHVVTSGDLP